MDIEKLKALKVIVETGSITRAAERLGYTPSGISRMVAALEEELGFPLLYRGRSGVSATGECETLLPALRQMVYQAESCRQTAASLRGLEQGSITVGANYRFYARQLAQLEEQAALGRACLEQLKADTVRLARLADKGLEPGGAEAMVKGLDGQQLMALKQSFEARAAEKYPLRTQLSYSPAEGERDREHDRAFLI